jgi:hypothetical protein
MPKRKAAQTESPVQKTGRPPTERGAYNWIPNRALGRIPDDVWAEIKAGAERAGVPFTQWAAEILLKAARKQR